MSQSLSHVVVLVITGEEGERRRHTNILVNKPRRVSNKSVGIQRGTKCGVLGRLRYATK
jgi:hypothetical protein